MDISEYIRESNAIEGIYGSAEVEQSLKAWELLTAETDRLTHGLICDVQRIVTANQTDLRDDQRGAYRDLSETNVRVGPHIPPPFWKVRELMDEWVEQYPKWEPWENHVRFETIHPFRDGNGRVGRFLMWWQQLQEGEALHMFRAADRFDYYAALEADRQKLMLGKERPRG